jgi:multidrug efflux system membrane fusion protein
MNHDKPNLPPQDAVMVPAQPKRGGAGRVVAIVLAVAAIGGLAWLVRVRTSAPGGGSSGAGGAPSASGSAARVTPVTVTLAESRDVPMVLEGLGNVLPLATVTVKTQIDGRLDSVLFKEGQTVKKGDLLALVDSRPFAIAQRNAEAQLAKDQAQLDNARLNEGRYQKLLEQKLVSEQQLTDQHAQTAQLLAQVRQDQAAVDSARLNIDYAHIVSPIDGVTGVRQVDQGNIVHPSDSAGIVVITQLDPIAVLFTLPEDDLPKIAPRQKAGPIAVDAFARDGVTKLGHGELTVIDNQINSATATIRLKATFPNADRSLWPNEFVKARLILTTKKGATVIPAAAIQRGPNGVYVYVVGEDGTAAMRPCEVDSTQGEIAVIAKGVNPGDRVISDGQSQLAPGSRVAARPASSAGPQP